MTAALHIVKVMPFFDPAVDYGGPVTQAASTCRGLARRGHRLSVVTTDLGQAIDLRRDTWIERDGYRVYYGTTRPWHRLPPYPAPQIEAPLSQALDDADLMCLNVGLTLLNVTASRLARQRARPYVYNAEGCLCPRRLAIKAMRKRWFLRLYERRLLAGATRLQAVTTRERQDLLAQGASPERVVVIPNGVEAAPSDSSTDIRQRFGIGPEQPLVLYFGRIAPLKGIDLLIRSMIEVLATMPNAQLLIVGPDHGLVGSLRQLATKTGTAHRVAFGPPIAAAERAALFAAADVFALTSLSEGLPNAALEAAAAGLPLLLTDPCNLPEVTTMGAGQVVAPAVQPIAAALVTMLGSASLRQQMSRNARRMIAECFAMPVVLDRLEALYMEAAGR